MVSSFVLLGVPWRTHGGAVKACGSEPRRTRDGARVQGQLHFVDPTDEILALLVEEARGPLRRPAIVDEQGRDVLNDRFLDADIGGERFTQRPVAVVPPAFSLLHVTID